MHVHYSVVMVATITSNAVATISPQYTVEPLYRGHHWDPVGCPVRRDVPNSEVHLHTKLCGRDSKHHPH